MKRTTITARVAGKEINLQLSEWGFMAKGEGHLVLHNTNRQSDLYWQVMLICTHQIHSHPPQIQNIYHQIIRQMDIIGTLLLQRDFVQLVEQDKLFLKQFFQFQLGLDYNIPQKLEVYLAQNLRRSRSGWQYWLQFKPKTALPDKYSSNFLSLMSQKIGLQTFSLIKLLYDRPAIEKTRWFKKNALKQNKKNMNPLEIFGIESQQTPKLVEGLRLVQGVFEQQNSAVDKQQLNDLIIKLIRSSQVLNAIARLQLLHTGSSDKIEQDMDSLWEKVQDKQAKVSEMKTRIKAQMEKEIAISDSLSNLIHSSVLQQGEKNQQDQLLEVLKFLISWSWRDVSLIIRLRTNQQKVTEIDCKIIDYELKEASKLKKTLCKDETFLLNYLKYLRVI